MQYVDRYVFIAIAYMSTWVYKYPDRYLVVTVCFGYRSSEGSQGEAAGQAESTIEHVPWETCVIA